MTINFFCIIAMNGKAKCLAISTVDGLESPLLFRLVEHVFVIIWCIGSWHLMQKPQRKFVLKMGPSLPEKRAEWEKG